MKKLFITAGLLLSAGNVLAVNPVALWMPTSLQELMPQLTKAAEMAEATERCDKVMSGRHSSKRSTPERPVFSIVCRDATTKRTYSILYAVENGQIVEFSEQQRGEEGKSVTRPWENPALKPVQDPGQTQSVQAQPVAPQTPAPSVPIPPSPAAQALNTSPSEQTATPSAAIDSRLAKLMARLEAAGVKGASAKAMMQDMQRKTLEEQLSDDQQSQSKLISRSASSPAPVENPEIAAAPITPIPVPPIKETQSSSPATTQNETKNVAANPPSIAEGVSSEIAMQLWAQCLPAIKEKTASMIDRVLDEKTIPQGYSGDAGSTNMDIPFEAKNPEGMNLRFTAVCTVDAGGAAKVKLRPRRE